MHIILGAAGQIGSMLIDDLLKKKQTVRAVVRNENKSNALREKGAEVVTADIRNADDLKKVFHGGKAVFLLTPENPECKDFIGETKTILSAYREAVLYSGIGRVIGLSSMGAQHENGTGNLSASYLLEHSFEDFDVEQVFIRPSYYFSNWLGYQDLVREYGILPTFFPPEMKLAMIAPTDVAAFLSDVMTREAIPENILEITGPLAYSSQEIAKIYGEVFHRKVSLQQVFPADWEKTLMEAGFSEDGTRNLMLMTQAVIDGKTQNETGHVTRFPTDFKEYLLRNVDITGSSGKR